jgi:hypothetical protein
MELEDRIIAFVDIIGFKELVVKSEQMDQHSKICQTLLFAIEHIGFFYQNHNFRFTHFSDCFVLSINNFNINTSMQFTNDLQDLVAIFLEENILLRWGITIRKLIHTDKLVVGTGLIQAYKMESESAKYPRIIIDPELVNLWSGQLEDYNFDKVLEISEDTDGYYYVDYIKKNNAKLIDKAVELCNHQNERIKEKGEWFLSKLRK